MSPEEAYLNDALARLDALAAAANTVAEVMERADVRSDAWLREADAALEALRSASDAGGLGTAPAGLAEVESTLRVAFARFTDASGLLAQGIEALDPDMLLEAAELAAAGVADVATARTLVVEAQAALASR